MDDHAGLRRKDTTKGPPLRILSLDGGGVRGYSMFIILQELMHRTFVEIHGRAPKREEIPKPCDHFDLIVGTGTGGLVAIMLGRLRLDLDTCKEVYVRMTRRVFETDKMVLGLPLKGTMFKATKLEESIRDCVREHTVFEDEGNDSLANAVPMTPNSAFSSATPSSPRGPQRSMSQGSRYSQIGQGSSSAFNRFSFSSSRFGNPNALLYDTRENRTKTAVTAVLKGTSVNTMLRSYDSRRETAPDDNCMIWQAGRATAATQMAFKPIQIGQSIYLDEGAGKFNPSPQVLDEAVQNEWPGREVGVFVSVGTGKRPHSSAHNQQEWWEGFLGGGMGDFAEARRKMIAKLEACEDIHRYMLREHLTMRGVPLDNYFRLNVEVGVGEFGMNEWNRLADISTNTRMYLSKNEVQTYTSSAAQKLAKVHLAKLRHERSEARRNGGTDDTQPSQTQWQAGSRDSRSPPIPSNVVELPGDESYQYAPRYDNRLSVTDEKYAVIDEYDEPNYAQHPAYRPAPQVQPARQQHDFSNSRLSTHSYHEPPSRVSQEVQPAPTSPPPLPPKTPMSSGGLPYPDREAPQTPEASTPQTFMNMGDLARRLPYPDVQGPPPPVNTANKPQISK